MANWGVLIIILAHPLLILVHFRKIVNLRLGTMFWSLKLCCTTHFKVEVTLRSHVMLHVTCYTVVIKHTSYMYEHQLHT